MTDWDSTEELLRLSSEERLRLVRFLCSFAWADLDAADREKDFVRVLTRKMGVTPEESLQVEEWLAFPPDPDTVDPTEIPPEHKQVFLAQCLKMVQADGTIDSQEIELLSLFEQLILDE